MLPRGILLPLLIGGGLILTACGKDQNGKKKSPPPGAEQTQAESGEENTNPPSEEENLLKDVLIKPDPLTGWQLDSRIAKAARDLTGKELTQGEIAALAAQDRVTTVNNMMTEEGFLDQVMLFNLYFLGFGRDGIRTNNHDLSTVVLNYPHAVSATRAVATGGDFFQLFDHDQPYYVAPMSDAMMPYDPENPTPDPNLSHEDIVNHLFTHIDQQIQKILQDEEAGEFSQEDFCNRVGYGNGGITITLYYLGLPSELVTDLRLSPQWLGDLDLYCFLPNQPRPEILHRFSTMQANLPLLKKFILEHHQGSYRLQDFKHIAVVDPDLYGLPAQKALTTIGFYADLTNSSTNYNRRRGAYILKRFFCDDLAPISIELPENHGTTDQHASDPGCQSCHYKLDPMAGFFKDVGIAGKVFEDEDDIQFDDFATVDKETYQSSWHDPAGERDWNIGYIRSATDKSRNSYGESLVDLFTIIKSSREPKKCLIRRLHQYLVGEDQIMDGGYLDYLTDKMIAEAEVMDSASAFRRTMARIILSNGYSTIDPNSHKCYDQAPGDIPEHGRPPCEVAAILENNCASCHSSTSALGGLDVTKWVLLPDGKPGFLHRQSTGELWPQEDSLNRISERLTTTAPNRRMPLDQHINSTDLETLFLWIESQTTQGGE